VDVAVFSLQNCNHCSKSRLLLVCSVSVCVMLCLCLAVCRVLYVIAFYYTVCVFMVVTVLLRMVGNLVQCKLVTKHYMLAKLWTDISCHLRNVNKQCFRSRSNMYGCKQLTVERTAWFGEIWQLLVFR